MINLSILDYSPVDENTTDREALLSTTKMARQAEESGFKRFWVSEHHGMKILAGSNPEMLMMHPAASTSKIRIGSGGVMLQHYSAYKVAESFKMLEALYPERIDLGTGRAAGGDKITQSALNIGKTNIVAYEQQLKDLQSYLTGSTVVEANFAGLHTSPLIETLPEMWSLGAGESGAILAAQEGTSFIFAHFINPSGLGIAAIKNYKSLFKPSLFNTAANTMVAIFVAIAGTEHEAETLAKGFDHWLLMIESGRETPYYMSPEHQYNYSEQEKRIIKHNRSRIIVGTPASAKEQILLLASQYQTNEIMLLPHIYGVENRLRSIALIAKEFDLNKGSQNITKDKLKKDSVYGSY